jgi:TonB family protein
MISPRSLTAVFVLLAQYPGAARAETPSAAHVDLVPPRLTHSVDPIYPESRRASGAGASVVVTLTLDATGQVTAAAIAESAGPEFDEAALAAARQLVFDPAQRAGKPVPARIPFKFTFVTQPASPPAALVAPSTATAAPSGVTPVPTGATPASPGATRPDDRIGAAASGEPEAGDHEPGRPSDPTTGMRSTPASTRSKRDRICG